MMFLDPRFWLLLCVCTIGAGLMGHGTGYAKAEKEAERKELKVSLAHAEQLQAMTQDRINQQREFVRTMDHLAAQYHQKETHAKAHADRLVTAYRDGQYRLSLAVRSCTGKPATDPGHTGPESGAEGEARAELMPATAADLISVANDGDSAVRQLNAVIDAYAELRRYCQQQVAPPK